MRAGGYYSEQKQSNYGMLVMPKLRRRLGFRLVQKLTCQDSAVCNRQLLDAIASAWRCGELFICVKTSYGIDMRCRENISDGRKHMVEVEDRVFKCVPGRWARRRIWSSSSEI